MAKHPKPRFEILENRNIPETRGRRRYDESAIVERYIAGRLEGIYKTHLSAAKKLQRYAAKHSGGEQTKIDRLRRKFSKAWQKYLERHSKM